MKRSYSHYLVVLATSLALGLLSCPPAYSQIPLDMQDIDTILADNQFSDLTNRYASILLSFFPERGTRLGFLSANEKLDERSPEHSAQALLALEGIRKQMQGVDRKHLSEQKLADLELMLKDVNYMIWLEEHHRAETSPLYYAEAFDSVYDLRLKQTSSPIRQRLDILARLKELDRVATQAETYLTQAPAYQAQLAMEKAYYAFLSMDELTAFLLKNVTDPDTVSQITEQAVAGKKSIRRLFNLFKKLSQEENAYDFRLGEQDYTFLLNNQYQIKQKTSVLLTQLQDNLQKAQERLTKVLEPFMQAPQYEDVTVLDVEAPSLPPEEAPAAQKSSLRNAKDFYTVFSQIPNVEAPEDPLASLKNEAEETVKFFNQLGILPARTFTFNVDAMPQYYAYSQAYLFVPPYGDQSVQRADFFLRLPTGNELAQQEQLNRDFNPATQKLMLTGELMPGRYYQTVSTAKLSAPRRFYPAKTIANGWSAYAQQLAQEKNFIVTDEELVFVAWNEYVRALKAWTDAKLNTRQFSYADALDMLTTQHGLEQKQAEEMIKQVILTPGEALSYQAGLDMLNKLHAKYKKKQGKKFSEADFNSYLLNAGNVTPEYLDKELEQNYKAHLKK